MQISEVSYFGLVFFLEDGDEQFVREGKKERDGKIYFKNHVGHTINSIK